MSTIPPAVISNMRVSPSKFSLAGRKVNGRCVKPTHKNNHNQHCRRGIKLSVSYSLNVSARVTFTIQRKAPGRKVSGRCVKPTARLRRAHARRCTLSVKAGTLIRASEPAGADTLAFSGRIGRQALKPGAYKAVLTASDTAGTSAAVTLSFTVVR